jgi:hypothetical protein
MGALSMITKAGMPSSKVVVGVTSYGRSFRMAEAGCTGPDCTFTGTKLESHATPGRCTGTSGYISDAEIGEIIQYDPSARTWTEDFTDYLVYNSTDWVAYMSPANKAFREFFYEGLSMGGSTDWAVDLQSFVGGGDQDSPDGNVVYVGPQVYDQKTAQCKPPCILVLPPIQLASDTVIAVPPYTTSLEVGSSVGGSFVVTTTTITVIVAPITTRQLGQSNVKVEVGQTGGFNPTPSVPVPHPTFTVTNGNGVAMGRTLTLPPWPAITNGPPNSWSTTTGFSASFTWNDPPYTRQPLVLPCYPGLREHYLEEYDAIITLGSCPPSHMTTLDQDCGAPTATVRIEEDPAKSFSLGCTLFTGTGTRSADSNAPLPTRTTWDGELEWEDDEEGDDDDDDDDDSKSSCNLWFFHVSGGATIVAMDTD